MNLTTVASRAIATLVAAVAGFASYRHIYDVASGAGEHRGVAAVLPLAIDGLIVVATLAMLEDKRNRRRPRLSARVALVFGILATLAANVASAEPTATARMVAAIPAISFLLSVEVLARNGKPLPSTVTPTVTPAEAAAPVAVTPKPTPAGPPVDATPTVNEPVTVTPANPPVDAKPRANRTRPKSLTNAEKVARAAAKLPTATAAQIAAKAGVSESTARRHLPSPTEAAPAATTVNGTSLETANA